MKRVAFALAALAVLANAAPGAAQEGRLPQPLRAKIGRAHV